MGNSLFAFYHRIFYGILILLRWILNIKIPFLLLIQAACFCLPHLFWEKMCNYSGKIHIPWIFVNLLCFFLGINVNQVLNVSADPANIKKETKDQNVQAVGQHLRVCLNNCFCLRSYCYVSYTGCPEFVWAQSKSALPSSTEFDLHRKIYYELVSRNCDHFTGQHYHSIVRDESVSSLSIHFLPKFRFLVYSRQKSSLCMASLHSSIYWRMNAHGKKLDCFPELFYVI